MEKYTIIKKIIKKKKEIDDKHKVPRIANTIIILTSHTIWFQRIFINF